MFGSVFYGTQSEQSWPANALMVQPAGVVPEDAHASSASRFKSRCVDALRDHSDHVLVAKAPCCSADGAGAVLCGVTALWLYKRGHSPPTGEFGKPALLVHAPRMRPLGASRVPGGLHHSYKEPGQDSKSSQSVDACQAQAEHLGGLMRIDVLGQFVRMQLDQAWLGGSSLDLSLSFAHSEAGLKKCTQCELSGRCRI